ncbi:MAG: TVP38/TMEM64 family protein [Elusimicrobiota bacterium]
MNRKIKPLLILLALVALAAVLAGADIRTRLIAALTVIESLGAWAPAAFIGVYILATVLFLPGSILTLGAGLLFGVVHGTIYVSVASTLGATAAFLVGRYFARAWVAGRIEGNAKFKAIDEAVAGEGWKIVGLTRLSPVFPFNMLNYAFGLTRVSLRDYFFASWIGMLPGTVLYVYLGSIAGELATLGAGAGQKSPAQWALTVVGLIATVAVTFYITRIARTALDQRMTA